MDYCQKNSYSLIVIWIRAAYAKASAAEAGVAELVDARDLKSLEDNTSCGFESHLRHRSV